MLVAGDVAGQHPGLERDQDRVLDVGGRVELTEVAQHHHGGQDDGGRIDHVLARILRRGSMDGLEDRDLVSDVGARGESESSDERGGFVGEDVAVHVGRDDHVELLRALDELVGAVVDDDVIGLHPRVLGRDLLEGLLQHALGELHDVGLRGAVNGGASLGDRELEREADDLLASLAGDQLQRLGDAGGLHMLDPRVEVLHVLPDDHEIDAAAAVRRANAGELPRGPHVRVGLEELAQGDVGALLAEPHGGLERSLEDDARPGDGFDRLRRHARGKSLLEHLRAREAFLPLDLGPGSLDDSLRGPNDLGTDPVPGDDRDEPLSARALRLDIHGHSLSHRPLGRPHHGPGATMVLKAHPRPRDPESRVPTAGCPVGRRNATSSAVSRRMRPSPSPGCTRIRRSPRRPTPEPP